MNNSSATTLDLGTMINRLSILASVPHLVINDQLNDDTDDNSDNKSDDNETADTTTNEQFEENEENENNDINNVVDMNDKGMMDLKPLSIIVNDGQQNNVYEDEETNGELLMEDIYAETLRNYESENMKLKQELIELKKLLSNNNNNENVQQQMDKLKYENKILNEKLNEANELNSSVTAKCDKLQKYEQFYKKMECCEINGKYYQIVSKIGQGGFSEVFHCISLKESKSFALKKVTVNDEQNETLMMNEIELLKRLQSTNKVIQLFDYEYIRAKKCLLLIMEMGSTDLNHFLKKELQKSQCIEEPTRSYLWFKMLEAVQAIHGEGIIHSDIKPSNFLIVGYELKLIDFNISNTINDRTSVTVVCDCGTLNYMAPESLQHGDTKAKVNQKVDVWALGCILYLMTYGRLPFQDIKNQYKMMFAICDPNKKIDFPIINDKDLHDVLVNCLRHYPNERYSIDELLNHRYMLHAKKQI